MRSCHRTDRDTGEREDEVTQTSVETEVVVEAVQWHEAGPPQIGH